jgi:poly-gamma-glutamate synthesis protein (capsule biosynthesis protein)
MDKVLDDYEGLDFIQVPSHNESSEREVSEDVSNDTFVKIRDYIPDSFVDLKYATSENITGTPIYDFTEPYLRYGTVKKLETAYKQLLEQGYTLKIWDGYRPVSAQFKLWEAMPDARYIANPHSGYSNHSRGNAVDLTLVKADGSYIPMPTDYDDFSARADRNYEDLGSEVRNHVMILEKAMTEAGFEGYFAEWWHYSDESKYPVEENFEPAVENDIISISAVGDTLLANGHGFWYDGSIDYYIESLGVGYDYFLEKVQSVIGQDDLTISNNENVFSTRGERANKSWQGNEAFWFRSDPEYAQIYKEGSIEAVSLANNHTYDYGQIAYEDTIAALDAQGITNFGYDRIAYYQVRDYTIALLGHNVLGPLERGVDIEELKSEMKDMLAEAESNADIVISSFHWGIERSKTQNAQQTELALFAIDNGSDLILGHHPHIVQPVEEYQGVPIAYSLGDFVFGGNRHPIKTQ